MNTSKAMWRINKNMFEKESRIDILDEHNWDISTLCDEIIDMKETIGKLGEENGKLEGTINDLNEEIEELQAINAEK